MDSEWFYALAGAQHGPVSFEAMRSLALEGRLRPEDLVWKAGLTAWVPAHSIEGLLPPRAAGSPPPLPQAAPPAARFVPDYQNPTMPTSSPADAGMRFLLPVNRSGWAIASGYLGLFSVLMIFAPLAVLTGLLALREMHRRPHLHGAGRAWFGIIMGSIFSVFLVLMVIALVSR